MIGFGVQGSGFRVRSGFGVLGAVALAVAPAFSQGRISNAKTETRSAAQGLEREVRALASRGGVTWIAVPRPDGGRAEADVLLRYDVRFHRFGRHVPAGERQRRLDEHRRPPRPQRIADLARAVDRVSRARPPGERRRQPAAHVYAGPGLRVDAGGMAVVWLSDVKTDDSLAWLASLVGRISRERRHQGARRQDGDDRGRAPQRAGGRSRSRSVRRAGAAPSGCAPTRRSGWETWRGETGARLLTRMIAQDPSDKVRDKVAFRPLGQQGAVGAHPRSSRPPATTRARESRPGALWLAQKAGKDALARRSPARSTTTRTLR